MASFFRRWGWRHLLGSWVVYWIGLAAIKLWEPLSIARGLSRTPYNASSVSAMLENGQFSASIASHGVTLWSANASLLEIGLWIAGPPLLLWALWAVGRSGERRPDPSLGFPPPNAALRDGVGLEDPFAARADLEEAPRVKR
jgi:hypothetical protein